MRRKALLVLAVGLGACGGDSPAKPHSTTPQSTAAPSAVAARCHLQAAGGDGGFPAGLLPEGSVVTGEGTAVADGKLAAVFGQLRDGAPAAGLEVRDSELETLDAELELEGSDGDVGLRLGLAPKCARATRVRLAD